MMAMSDPNKQTFPIIQNPTHYFVPSNCPSPTKTAESIPYTLKHSSIQLPSLVHPGEGDVSSKKEKATEQNATNVCLPKVKKTFAGKKTVSSEARGSRIPENFRQVDVEPMPYQCQAFRSTTKVKEVQVSKRHRDMFSAAARSKPGPLAKTKNMSFYTKPFLWQAKDKAGQQTETKSLPSRFLEEEANLKETRGQKRKYNVPSHRQGYKDLYVGGNVSQISPKFDYKTEADNLRFMVLPENAQELYMGRGIKLPESHSTNRRRQEWKAKIESEYTLPNSAPAAPTAAAVPTTAEHPSHPSPPGPKPDGQAAKPRSTTSHPPPKLARSQSLARRDSDAHSSSVASSERSGPGRRPERRRSQAEGARRNSEVMRRGSDAGRGKSEKTKQGEEERVAASQPTDPDKPAPSADEEIDMEGDVEADDSTAVEVQTIPEENKDAEEPVEVPEDARPDSVMEMEAQEEEEDPSRLGLRQGTVSTKGASPNPLTSVDITLHISAGQKEALAERFSRLDANRDGHITFQELTSVLPETLTKSQRKFIKEVYEAVSSSTFFGLEEFVGVTCLGELMTDLPGQVGDAYDTLNFTTIQQHIMQFVMMFSSVDRQQTGTISIASLIELLSMVTDKDLVSDQTLIGRILTNIGKDLSSTIDKVEFLAFLPYFLQLR